MRDLAQPGRSGHSVIATEGEEHPARRGNGCQTAQAHGDGDGGAEPVAQRTQVVGEGREYDRGAAVVLAAEPDRGRNAAGVEDLIERRQMGRQSEQDDVADHS